MSVVTNIVITCSWYENFRRHVPLIDEINHYFYDEDAETSRPYFKKAGEDFQVGGDRVWEGETFMAAINGLEVDSFIQYLENKIDWREPENVIIIIQGQHDSYFRVVRLGE